MSKTDYTLDVLKALAITLVLIWHLQPIRVYPIDNTTTCISEMLIGLTYARTLVGVPIFYFVSLLLFFEKIEISNSYIFKRTKRLLHIFVFWSLIQFIVYFLAKQVSFFLQIPFNSSPQNTKFWWLFVMGGPSLPAVGDSVFYFLFNLILLTILSYYYKKIASKYLDLFLFVIFSVYMVAHQFFYIIPYWRIDNFLIYIPLSHFVAKKYYYNLLSVKSFLFSLFMYILFCAYEIIFYKYLNTMQGGYDVNSLQWGVISLFIFLKLLSGPKNIIIDWLSKYSLGLFAFHKYYFLLFLFIFSKLSLKSVINIGDGAIQYDYFFIALITIFFTCITIKLFSLYEPLKKYVA